jgi:glycosyltransferase involved in cell wall biosynthesis
VKQKFVRASIIIPARDAMATLGRAVESILNTVDHSDIEIIIVNDGLDKSMVQLAEKYPVKVIEGNGKGPAAARNIGVRSSIGQLLVFLDADCHVSAEWLKIHFDTHQHYGGLLAVGGSICLEPGACFWARCDHYSSWYNVNPERPAAWIPNHTPANLSVGRKTFQLAGPFQEDLPRAGVHEESQWQGRLLRLGGRIRFEPRAKVWHVDRDDPKSYLKHNYWWGYNSITVKNETDVSRFPWVYKKPWVIVSGFVPFAIAHTIYTVICWVKVKKVEPILLIPFIFLGRMVYAIGMVIGRARTIYGRKKLDLKKIDAYQNR